MVGDAERGLAVGCRRGDQLVGWLEGLFQGIQASLVAQQLAARQQLEQMRRLGPGQQVPGQGTRMPEPGPGTYL